MQPEQPSQFHPTVIVQQPPTNALGVVGLVLSCAGIFTCGLLSPVALLPSVAGLFREPRGTAIAGTVLSFLGCGWLIAFGATLIAGVLGIGAAAKIAGDTLTELKALSERAGEIVEIQNEIKIHIRAHKSLPDTPTGNKLIADMGKKGFQYKLIDDSRFSISDQGKLPLEFIVKPDGNVTLRNQGSS